MSKKYRKSPTGFEGHFKRKEVNYDVEASLHDLVKMFDLLKVKFDIHNELALKENKVIRSLAGIHEQFLKLSKALETVCMNRMR